MLIKPVRHSVNNAGVTQCLLLTVFVNTDRVCLLLTVFVNNDTETGRVSLIRLCH